MAESSQRQGFEKFKSFGAEGNRRRNLGVERLFSMILGHDRQLRLDVTSYKSDRKSGFPAG